MHDTEVLRQTIRRLPIELRHNDAALGAELQRGAAVRPLTAAKAGVACATIVSTELSDYRDFGDAPAIRLRSHRIWIKKVRRKHIYCARNVDELAARFSTLTCAEIHAVPLYYYRHQAALDRRLADWLDHGQRAWAAQQRTQAPVVEKLRGGCALNVMRRSIKRQPPPWNETNPISAR